MKQPAYYYDWLGRPVPYDKNARIVYGHDGMPKVVRPK